MNVSKYIDMKKVKRRQFLESLLPRRSEGSGGGRKLGFDNGADKSRDKPAAEAFLQL
jgi:hypothetical protein